MKIKIIFYALVLVQAGLWAATPADLTSWYTQLRTMIRTDVNASNLGAVAALTHNLLDARVADQPMFNSWVSDSNDDYVIECWPIVVEKKMVNIPRYGPLVLDFIFTLTQSQPTLSVGNGAPAVLDDFVTLLDYIITAAPTQVDVQMHDSLGHFIDSKGRPYPTAASLLMTYACKTGTKWARECLAYFPCIMEFVPLAANVTAEKPALKAQCEAIPALGCDPVRCPLVIAQLS